MGQILGLRDVFSRTYHFKTEYWQRPSKSAYNALRRKLDDFFLNEHDDGTNLLIIYYGGHGPMDGERRCVWSWCVIHTLIASSPYPAFQKPMIINNDLNSQALLALAPTNLPHSLGTPCKVPSSNQVRTS